MKMSIRLLQQPLKIKIHSGIHYELLNLDAASKLSQVAKDKIEVKKTNVLIYVGFIFV